MRMFKFELGAILRDVVTGFEGVVMVRSQYFTGCAHYGLERQKLTKDGQPDANYTYFDETRLRQKGIVKLPGLVEDAPPRRTTSGPMPEPPTRR